MTGVWVVDTAILAVCAAAFVGLSLATFFKWRAHKDAWESFLIALSENLVSVHMNEPAREPRWSVDRTVLGHFARVSFSFTYVDNGNRTCRLEFKTMPVVGKWLRFECHDVPKDDIGHPLSRAWIKLGRVAKSEWPQRASA